VVYLPNVTGPGSLVPDLRIDYDRFVSRSDPILNGHLHYPNDIDKSLNEAATDKVRNFRYDYKNNPSRVASFMTVISSLTGSSGN
jgi:hypothetical protein